MRILTYRRFHLLSFIAAAWISFASCKSGVTQSARRQASVSHRIQSSVNNNINNHVIERTSGGWRKDSSIDNNSSEGNNLAAALIRGGSVTPQTQAIAGVVVLALIEQVVRKSFLKFQISFPSQLGGCMILLSFMLLAEAILPGWGDSIYEQLAPGAGLLAKWLPSFFVPGLTMLPLAPKIGDGGEVAKVLAVVILGFMFTLSTVSFSVLALRTAQGAIKAPASKATAPPPTTSVSSPSAVKPFRDETMQQLFLAVVVSGIVSAGVTKLDVLTKYQSILRTIFLGLTTVAAYVWGARLPLSITSVIHPLVTSTFVTWAAVYGFAKLTGSTFLDVLRTYKAGKVLPLLKAGAGDILLHLLGPAVVSFAVSTYSRKKLVRDNLLVVATAILVSSAGGLFGTAAFVRAIQLGGKSGGALVRLSMLARNVTTALAMVVTTLLGGDLSIVSVVVVLTGIFGATFGRTVLDKLRIQDPVSRGLGIGASSQGLGVASLAGEPDAFPFAAMSMVLNAIAATVLVSIPAVRTALIQLATGGGAAPAAAAAV